MEGIFAPKSRASMQREVPELDFCTYGGSAKPSRISDHPKSQIFFRYKRATRVAVGWLREEEGLLGGVHPSSRCPASPTVPERVSDRSMRYALSRSASRSSAGRQRVRGSLGVRLHSRSRPSLPRSHLSDSRVCSSRWTVGGVSGSRHVRRATTPGAWHGVRFYPFLASRIRLESIGSFGTAPDFHTHNRLRCVLRE
jgi:hypothetical protein